MQTKEAKREYDRQYCIKNRERKNAQARAYQQANPEKCRAAARARYLKKKETILTRHKEWREKNKEKIRAKRGQHEAPTRPMSNVCECCLQTQTIDLHEDHCHETGNFRGWLCRGCNYGIGLIGDTLDSARHAVRYLQGVVPSNVTSP